MTEAVTETPHEESIDALRARAEALELQLRQAMDDAQARLVRAELKAEAVRAGMVDLDGLKLIDPAEVKLSDSGEVEGAPQLMQRLKRTKPWLFGHGSTSSAATPPPAHPPRAKLATEMSTEEWRAARTEMLRRR